MLILESVHPPNHQIYNWFPAPPTRVAPPTVVKIETEGAKRT